MSEFVNDLYQDFILKVRRPWPHGMAMSEYDDVVSTWWRAEKPIPWKEARDRLIAAGLIDGTQAGKMESWTRLAPRGWMLSVSTHEVENWKHTHSGPHELPPFPKEDL